MFEKPQASGNLTKIGRDFLDLKIELFPHVYKPQTDTFFLIDFALPKPEDIALELCAGCGIISLHLSPVAKKVYATDFNPYAVANAKHNAKINGIWNIQIQQGDLYESVKDQRFDLIVANPPYVPTPPNWETQDIIETAFNAGEDGRIIIDRIIQGLPNHITSNGRFIMVQSSLADIEKTRTQLQTLNFHTRVIAEKWLPLGPVSRGRYHWLKQHATFIHPNAELLVIIEASQNH